MNCRFATGSQYPLFSSMPGRAHLWSVASHSPGDLFWCQMTPNTKRARKPVKRRNESNTGSDYRLIIVIVGAVILAFLMIYALIVTSPA